MIESAYLKQLLAQAAQNPKTIVLPEGEDNRVLDAAHYIAEAKAAKTVILGNRETIEDYYNGKGWNLDGIEIMTPESSPKRKLMRKCFMSCARIRELRPKMRLSKCTITIISAP